MPTVAEYPEAVARIARSDVPDDATTRSDVLAALADSGPQVTRDVATDLADAVVTVDDVREAIESTGELPSAGEIDALASLADEHDLDGRADAVADAVRDTVVTVGDVDRAVDDRAASKTEQEPLYREEIEAAVNDLAASRDVVGESRDDVVDRVARDRGAPTEEAYKQARARVVTTADTVDPRDVVDDPTDLFGVQEARASAPVPVVRDTDGEAVAVVGTGSSELDDALSGEIGVPSLSPSEVSDGITVDQDRGGTTLRLRGREVGEVEVDDGR